MEKDAIKKILKKSMENRHIYSEKYQDKYYVYKELQELLPDIPESAIYGAIDEVNKILKSPIKGKKFVDTFVEKLDI